MRQVRPPAVAFSSISMPASRKLSALLGQPRLGSDTQSSLAAMQPPLRPLSGRPCALCSVFEETLTASPSDPVPLL